MWSLEKEFIQAQRLMNERIEQAGLEAEVKRGRKRGSPTQDRYAGHAFWSKRIERV